MRLRTLIFLSLTVVAVVQAAVVVPLALRNVTTLLSQQQTERIDASMLSLDAAWKKLESDVGHAATELAESEKIELLARSRTEENAASTLNAALSEAMVERRLSVLALMDASGQILGSAHLPARAGDVDGSFAIWRHQTSAVFPALVEMAGPQGIMKQPALLSMRKLDSKAVEAWLVTGVFLDEPWAQFLAQLSGAQVEIQTELGVTAVAGVAPGPWVERDLPLASLGSIRLKFSQAPLQLAAQRVLGGFGALFALGLLLAVGVAWLGARRLSRPLDALSQAAQEISSGAWGTQVRTQAQGEIGKLVNHFNHMSETLQTTHEQLIATERVAAWQEVAKRMAHELKNPLTPIQMSLETLMSAHASRHPSFMQLFTESAPAVLEEVFRLKRIVQEFSQFARLPKPNRSRLELSDWVRSVLPLFPSDASRLRIESELQSDVWVEGDRDQLTQVLMNLLKNADEAMPDGGLVCVRLARTGTMAVLEVEDRGPGIPVEARQRIFEPYVTSKSGGTGLGLAITARICTEHQGFISVTDAQPSGARFIVKLPLSAPNLP